MLLNDVLDEVIALLEHPEFKNFGAFKKHLAQMEMKETNERGENARMMYEGTIGDPNAAKKSQTRRKPTTESNKKAAKVRSDWYKKHPENYEKFMSAIRRRDFKRQQAKEKAISNQSVQK